MNRVPLIKAQNARHKLMIIKYSKILLYQYILEIEKRH